MARLKIDPASTRLAAFLIALVALQILLSAVIPQQQFGVGRIVGTGEILEDANPVVRALQLDRIYKSPLFLVTLLLLAVNLVAGNIRRFRQVHRARRPLLKARHLGSMIFHFAILMVIAGVVLNAVTHFDGVLGVTEGQQVADVHEAYLKRKSGFLAGEARDRFRLTLERIDLEHQAGGATTEAALLTVRPPDGGLPVRRVAMVNDPLRWGGFEFHMGSVVGYSPEIVVLGSGGGTTFRSFVRLRARSAGPDSVIHRDYQTPFEDERRLGIKVRETEGGPVVDLAVEAGDRILAEGALAVGDTLTLDGERISVPRMRRWCYVYVVRNPFLWMIFTGFWVGLAGQLISVLARVGGASARLGSA